MSQEKKYYWIKLKTDFFNLKEIDFLLSQKGGCQYVVLYQMLCLLTANNKGQLATAIGDIMIPFDIDKIQRETKYFSREVIILAMDFFKKLGLIFEECDGILTISGHSEMVGSETRWAQTKRLQRNKNLLSNGK